MKEKVFDDIKSAIRAISTLQIREATFRKELTFFNQKYNTITNDYLRELYYQAFKRLEHEVGFLCIDAYSLHQGIEKKKSLYRQTIKNNAKLLLKVAVGATSASNTNQFGK